SRPALGLPPATAPALTADAVAVPGSDVLRVLAHHVGAARLRPPLGGPRMDIFSVVAVAVPVATLGADAVEHRAHHRSVDLGENLDGPADLLAGGDVGCDHDEGGVGPGGKHGGVGDGQHRRGVDEHDV